MPLRIAVGEGNRDPAEMPFRLLDAGFDGFPLDGQVPGMDADSDCDRRGRAIGRTQGLARMRAFSRASAEA